MIPFAQRNKHFLTVTSTVIYSKTVYRYTDNFKIPSPNIYYINCWPTNMIGLKIRKIDNIFIQVIELSIRKVHNILILYICNQRIQIA